MWGGEWVLLLINYIALFPYWCPKLTAKALSLAPYEKIGSVWGQPYMGRETQDVPGGWSNSRKDLLLGPSL